MSRAAAGSGQRRCLVERLSIDCRLDLPVGRPGADSRAAGTPTRFVAVDGVCPQPPARRLWLGWAISWSACKTVLLRWWLKSEVAVASFLVGIFLLRARISSMYEFHLIFGSSIRGSRIEWTFNGSADPLRRKTRLTVRVGCISHPPRTILELLDDNITSTAGRCVYFLPHLLHTWPTTA